MDSTRNSYRIGSSMARIAGITVFALAAVAPSTAQVSGAGSGANVPAASYRLSILPPGPGATGSSAAAIAEFGDPGDCLIGGSVQIGQHVRPAAWILARNEQIDGPFRLQDMGYGGTVSRGGAASGFFDIWTDWFATVMVGSVNDAQGVTRPALWTVNLDGSSELEVLPAQYGGEALGVAVGDVNNDAVPDIVVCGHQSGLAANTYAWATVWIMYGGREGDDQIEQTVLPGQVPSPLNRANAISFNFDRLDIAATYGTPNGPRCKSVNAWVPCDNFSVVDVAGGAMARTETVDNNETITIGGSLVNPGGGTTPALFTIDDGGVSTRTLPVLDGTSNTMMHGIIAILIGLVGGGETQTPQGRSAIIFMEIDDIEGESRVVDLNRVVSRPRGMRLNAVNALLPYMEQDNLYRAVGDATNAAGQMRGFVVTR